MDTTEKIEMRKVQPEQTSWRNVAVKMVERKREMQNPK